MDRRFPAILLAVLIAAAPACDSGSPGAADPASGGDVLQHHLHANRDGLYTDGSFTPSRASGTHLDPSFSGVIRGPTYAQPLYVTNGPSGRASLIVATEQNIVYALDAQTGAVIWQRTLGQPVPLSDLPCGNIDPLGVTGTPYIDSGSRTIYLDAMTTPDGGSTQRHLIFALSLDDGSTRPGWPVDVSATVTAGGVAFDSRTQNQRGALALVNGVLYVPYGGHFGDCGSYHGWLVAVPVSNPAAPTAWVAPVQGGAIWAPGGVVYDGTSIFVATGNTDGANSWSGGEAVIRIGAGASFSGATSDYFAPSDWRAMDSADLDLGGTNPALVDLPGGSSTRLALAFGKNGFAYVMNRDNLGGVGGGLLSRAVASGTIITAPAFFPAGGGVRIALKGVGIGCPSGSSGDLLELALAPASPPSLSLAWCATQNGTGSPIVSTTDGTSNPIVWSVGAEGDNRLHGFDGLSGKPVFGGGGPSDAMSSVRRYQAPIVAGGSLYVAGDSRVYRFLPGS
jgi:hypothetical protein